MELARAILTQSNGDADKVCRKLFGSVDHRQLQADFQRILRNTTEEAKRKWNFDFDTETPMEGAYKWEKVDCPVAKRQMISIMQEEKENPSILNGQIYCCGQLQESEVSSEADGDKERQTLITDYYQVKRRCSPGSSPKPSCS